jgi:hypothetical protein
VNGRGDGDSPPAAKKVRRSTLGAPDVNGGNSDVQDETLEPSGDETVTDEELEPEPEAEAEVVGDSDDDVDDSAFADALETQEVDRAEQADEALDNGDDSD